MGDNGKAGRPMLVGRIVLITLTAIVMQACVTGEIVTGKPIDEAKVAMIQNGETTSDQILKLFGAPESNTNQALYVYRYCVTYALDQVVYMQYKESCDELWVTFDETTGKVKAHNFQKGVKAPK